MGLGYTSAGLYLPIDCTDHSCFKPHPRHEADVEVLVEDQSLQAGGDEEECCVQVALPIGGVLVIHKVDEQPANEAGI